MTSQPAGRNPAPGAGAGAAGGGRAAGRPTDLTRSARTAVSVLFFATGATFAAWASRVPAVQDRLGLAEGSLAMALAGLAVGALVGLPLAGALVARWGSRRVLAGGFTTYLGALPMIALAPDLPMLTAVLAVFAAGNSAVDVAMNTQGVLVEHGGGRPVLGGFHAMFSLGGIVGAAVGSLAAARGASPAVHFLLSSGVLLVACAAVLPSTLPDRPGVTASGPPAGPQVRGLLVPGLITFCALMGEGVMNDWGAVYLHQVARSSASTAAAGFAVFSAGMVTGRLAADRLRGRGSTRGFLLACAGLSAAGAGLAVAVPHPVTGLAGYGLVGLGLAAVVPVVLSHVAARHRTGPGPAIAAVSTIGYLGFLAGPPLIGGIATMTELRLAMLVPLLLMVMMAGLSLRLPTARPAAAAGPDPGGSA